MKTKSIINNNSAVLEVLGDVDLMQDCITLSKDVRELLDGEYEQVVLDLSQCTEISASFCGFIIGMMKNAKRQATRFSIVVNPESFVSEMLLRNHVDKVIDIFRNTQEALAETAPAPSPKN